MKKQKLKNHKSTIGTQRTRRFIASVVVAIFAISTVSTVLVRADQFDEKINQLKVENAQTQANKDVLGAQAASLSGQIANLQAQIANLQAQINTNKAKSEDLQKQIAAAEEELAKQKKLLGENIKQMYLEGQISTLEMLASSKDLSDYVDKQQYRNAVKDKIKTTVDKITELRHQLRDQKETLDKLVQDQQNMQAQLATQQNELNGLLGMNQAQQATLDSQIKSNNSKIVDLRAQQAIENAKHFRGVRVVAGHNGNDTYPDAWRLAPQDSLIDNWGMYNRECVSYTAWKVYSTGRFMPYWGGIGNANQWDDNARRMGIPVDTTPRAGDIAVAHWGYYGHVMYVESVNANGTINISQYNWDFNGTYSEAYNFSTAGLVFIHFR